jgi:universal stress protein F
MYSSILVAVDLDRPQTWAKALPVACTLRRSFSARLTLCSVVRDMDAAVEAEWSAIGYRQMIDVAHARLSELASVAAEPNIDVDVGTGTICGGILDVAERARADLIVMASHMPNAKDHLLAANASRVVRRAPCSVLVVRGE